MGNSEDKSLTDKGLTLRLTSTSLGTSRSGSSDLNFSFFVLTLERSAILAASKMQSLRHGFAKACGMASLNALQGFCHSWH